MKIVHYVNQFFAGIGGEDAAGTGPELRDGAVGPGRRLATLLGDEHEIVATAICGDDYSATHPEFAAELKSLFEGQPDRAGIPVHNGSGPQHDDVDSLVGDAVVTERPGNLAGGVFR